MVSKTMFVNDDVLMEILEKLPLKSLFRFKCVSPEWRNLISSSTFHLRYAAAAAHRRSTAGDLVAFFHQDQFEFMDPSGCNILRICSKNYNINVPIHGGRFASSSNGLILFSRRFRGAVIRYHVVNPLTGKFVMLPPPRMGKGCLQVRLLNSIAHDATRPGLFSAALICEETADGTVPVYTVVRVGAYGFGCRSTVVIPSIYIDSYSSKTGEWSAVTELVSPTGRIDLQERPPVVANGVVHWHTCDGIALYDPNDPDQPMQLIDTPIYGPDAVTRSHDGVLWLAVLHQRKLMFYMLPKEAGGGGYKRRGGAVIGAEEWVLMHEVSLLDMNRMMKKGIVEFKDTRLECLIPESGSRSEVVLVLRQEKRVFFYNVQKKSLQKLEYSGSLDEDHYLCPYFYSQLLPPYHL